MLTVVGPPPNRQLRKAYCSPLPPSYAIDPSLMNLPPTKVRFPILFGTWRGNPGRGVREEHSGGQAPRVDYLDCFQVW